MILFTHHPLLLLLAVAALMSLSPSIITSLLTSSSSHHHSCSGAALALYLPPSTPAILHHRHYHHHQFRSRRRRHHFDVITSFYHDTSLHYKEPNSPNTSDDHNDASSSSASNNGGVGDSSGNNNNNNFNAWSVLANTERWIVDTLDRSNSAEAARRLHNAETIEKQQQQKNKLHFADEKVVPPPPPKDNPYARKEISYVCETQPDLLSVVGGIFRRVREARELGESHGRNVVMATPGLGEMSLPTTMRQTNVVVIPNCIELDQFHTFDNLVMAINQARRAARDFVIKKKDGYGDDHDSSKDWVVSINCAHLHPQYGMLKPKEQLASLQKEDNEMEVDVNLQEYKKRRDEARRSPYPSIIVEVLSTPPADFGSQRLRSNVEEQELSSAAAMRMQDENTAAVRKDNVDSDVTSEDVKRLEALFAMSAATKTKSSMDDPFYDALGEAFGNKQIISQTPLSMAQNWVLQNDPAFQEETSTFTTSNTRHVDAAYEFVFVNLAMLNAEEEDAEMSTTTSSSNNYNNNIQSSSSSSSSSTENKKSKRGQRSYVVLPNFVPTSATSFDRFAGQVSNIIRAIPSMAEKVMISTCHPEHVEKSTRSPVPIVVITWK